VNKLYEYRDGHVKEHLCDINEFMRKRKLERLNESRISVEEKKVEKAVSAGQNNLNEEAKKVKQLESKIKRTEEEIDGLEKKISEAEKVINQADFYEKNTDSSKVLSDYQTLKTKLEEKFRVWEGFSEELNKIVV
jgi:ATP-binding cassette subfamily F protein 3